LISKLAALLLVFCITGSAQILRGPMTLNPEQETWLTGDMQKTANLLHTRAARPDANEVLLYNTGYIHYLMGEDNEALNYFQKALDKNPDYPYAYLKMAEIYEKTGNILGALMHIKRVSDNHGDDYEVMLALARMYVLNGKKVEAERLYQDLISNFDEKIEPRIALAAIYRRAKKFEEAQKILEENMKIYPEDILLKEKARLYLAMGRKDKAAKYLLDMCDDYPFNEEIQQYRDSLQTIYGVAYTPKNYDPPVYRYRINPQERLDYVVKYGFVTLGWLNVRMLDAQILNGRKVYPIRFFVNSNPAFGMIIELHALYEAYIDAQSMNTIRSRAYTQGDGRYLAREYNFLYDEGIFRARIIYTDGRFEKLEKPLPSSAQDGVSMLYYARGVVSNKTGGTTTVVIDEEYKFGHIKYLNETESLEINDQDVEAVKIFARAEFKGVAGMNGDAWGWLSSDPQHIPLRGKVSIIVGSITLDVDEDAEDNVIDGKE